MTNKNINDDSDNDELNNNSDTEDENIDNKNNNNKNKNRKRKRRSTKKTSRKKSPRKKTKKNKSTKKNTSDNDEDKNKYDDDDFMNDIFNPEYYDNEDDDIFNNNLPIPPLIPPQINRRNANIPKKRYKLIIKDGKLIIKKFDEGDGDDDDNFDEGEDKTNKKKIVNPFDREGDFDVIIRREIKGIDDLIELGQMYDPNCNKKYNFDVMRLHSLIEPLTELKTLVGMEKVKQNIVNQIVFYLLKLDKKNQNMMHTVIEGSPGVGKTTLGKILAKIYLKMGVVTRDYFKVVKRSDLIAEYVGQTAPKTQKVIDEAKGGVLFIDEAYSLGNPEKKDIFSKECLDTININLSEMKDNFVMIIAGYKDSLKSSFFAYNDGLMRRFPFRYSIDDYKGDELHKIFLKVVNENEWEVLPKSIPKDFFNDNKHYFKFNGGDIESFFQTCKIAHARRVFCCPINERRKLTRRDITRGLELFLLNPEVKERKEEKDTLQYMFYT